MAAGGIAGGDGAGAEFVCGTWFFFPEECDLLSVMGRWRLRGFSEEATDFTSAFPSDLQASFGGPYKNINKINKSKCHSE